MNRWIYAALAIVCVNGVAAAAVATHKPYVEFTEATLSNGLRVQLSEDHTAPVVALNVTYDVGSRNERAGRTGFAHLFEHMMFKGSENVGTGEHFFLIFSNGGNMNGTTSADRTIYYETLSANQSELALFLEADRMRSLAITQANLDNQRKAVQEERRQSYDNQPYGKAYETLQTLVFDNFAYKHSTIGSMEDLNAATVDDVAQFFKMYYAPNNAVLTVVGDFDSKKLLERIRYYFEKIPRQPAPPPVDMKEPTQTAERRATLDDPLARLSQVRIAFKTAPGNTPDSYAMSILSAVLQSGDSSRLYRSIVKGKQLSPSAGSFLDSRRGTSVFYVVATVLPGRKVEDVEAGVNAELERLKTEPIAGWELEKALNYARVGYLNGIRSAQARATSLGEYRVFYNDPNLINTRLDKLSAITVADVQRVAKKYLVTTNRSVLIVNATAGAPAPAAK
jgi:zinc protease